MEILLKGKEQYSWPPCNKLFIWAVFDISNITYFNTKSCLNEGFNRTEPSLSVSVPCYKSMPDLQVGLLAPLSHQMFVTNVCSKYTIMNILRLLICILLWNLLYSNFEPLRSKTFLDTLSDILDKCLCFSLTKIESVSIYPSQAMLGSFFSSVVYILWLKMLSLVLIKNRNLFVYLIWILSNKLSNKLDLNQETRFTI